MRIILLLILLSSTLCAYDKPYPLIDKDKKFSNQFAVRTFDDVYSKFSLFVDNYSNQTISGNKTFSTVTISSLTVTSESFGDGTTQTTAYNVLTSSYVKLIGGGGQAFGSVTWENFFGAGVSLTTSGNTKVIYGYTVYAVNFAATMQCGTRMMVDGVDSSGGSFYGQAGALQSINEGITLSMTGMTDILAAGTHTFQLQAMSNSGTATLGNSSTLYIWAQEIR